MRTQLNTQISTPDYRANKNDINKNTNPSFQGYVTKNLAKHVNKLIDIELDSFITYRNDKVTKSEVYNQLLNPVKKAYEKLTIIMKEQFPDDVGVTVIKGDNEPHFFIKHKNKSGQPEYDKLADSPVLLSSTEDFIKFVDEIKESGSLKPSEITKYSGYYRNKMANKLLKEEIQSSKETYVG